MRRILTLSISILLAAALAGQTKKINSLKSQQAALQKQIQESQQLLNTTKKDVRTQLNNLYVLNSQIGAQQKYVDNIQGEVDKLTGSIRELEHQLDSLQADLTVVKRKYRRAVVYTFQSRLTRSKWSFVLGSRNFREMYRRMRYVANYSKYQRAQGELIRAKEAQVRQAREELAAQRTEKDRLLTLGKEQQQALEGKKAEQQKVVNTLNRKQSQLQSQIAQNRKKAANLNAQIERLIQQEIAAAERRRKEEARRREQAEKRQREQAEAARRKGQGGKGKATAGGKGANRYDTPAKTPAFRSADNANTALSGSFAANRGRLPIPITGSYAITARYGSYNVDGLNGVRLDNKGINITGRPGAQARAVFQGEVTSIFNLGGLYNVIVRHGSYMTVYCNLSAVSVRTGQQVSARQTLGTVAKDASGNCTLHFQLRKETATQNPEAWLAR